MSEVFRFLEKMKDNISNINTDDKTIKEIENIKFNSAAEGYDKKTVDDFLDMICESLMEIRELKDREADKSSRIREHMNLIESVKKIKDEKLVLGLYGLKCTGTWSWVSTYESMIIADIEGRHYVVDPTRGNNWTIREAFGGEADYLSNLFLEKTASIEQKIYEDKVGLRSIGFTDLIIDEGVIGVYRDSKLKVEIDGDAIPIYNDATGLYKAGGLTKALKEGKTVGYIKARSIQKKIQSLIVENCSKRVQAYFTELYQFNKKNWKIRKTVRNAFVLVTIPIRMIHEKIRKGRW